MDERTIVNPITRQQVTFLETARESGGACSLIEAETAPGGGVLLHRHDDHEEVIDVLEGEIELTNGGVTRRFSAGEHIVIAPGAVHSWRNPSVDRLLKFRGVMTPGHPGFETVLRVSFGLGRDGELRAGGLPRRFVDLALLTDWDPSLLAVGVRRWLTPLMRWSARRTRARGRAAELLRRYGGVETSPPGA